MDGWLLEKSNAWISYALDVAHDTALQNEVLALPPDDEFSDTICLTYDSNAFEQALFLATNNFDRAFCQLAWSEKA